MTKLLAVPLILYATVSFNNWIKTPYTYSKTIVALPTPTNNERSQEDTGREGQTIDRFLEEYGSPLAGQGEEIVNIGSNYSIDPYLLTAISVIESGACREPIGFNCLGFGAYRFPDGFIAGFRAVAEALSGEGTNGHYYSKCYKGDSRTRLEVEECLLGTYNTENPNYTNSVLKQRDYIQSYKY